MLNSDRLINLRKSRGFTQEYMAKKLGIDRTTYGKYETYNVQPANDVLINIARLFNVSTDYLLNNSDDPTPPNKKADNIVDEPIFITMQSFYKELPVKDQQKMDRVLKTIFEEMFPKNKDDKDVPK